MIVTAERDSLVFYILATYCCANCENRFEVWLIGVAPMVSRIERCACGGVAELLGQQRRAVRS
jgi:hypothetical protein